MSAATARSFPRHTHDQYGVGLVDRGGHASWSGRGHVEAGRGQFICVNPGEVHDGRPIGRIAATWAIDFYRRHGLLDLVDADVKAALLRKYWSIPERQIETSVVLASEVGGN
jgi:hypothetical protein